jgi:hypothetical protein
VFLEGLTMKNLRKIAFLLEEFSKPSPAQQLVDRFLAGYVTDGEFRRSPFESASAYVMLSSNPPDLEQRIKDFKLVVASRADQAVEGADGVVIASRKPGALANERFVQIALERAPEGAACFVHGVLANSLERGREFAHLARSRKITLLAGTPLCVTWRLPEVELPPATPLSEALIVVQANPSPGQTSPPSPPSSLRGAELQALEGLLPVIERRRGGESGVRSIWFMEGKELWKAGDKGNWSWPLLAAALSRSHSLQGDPVLDGRTQDLAGLGLVPKLARNPRGWLLEHRDGLRSAILVLDGVVADFNFAVRAQDGSIVSAQLYRAPAPAEQHFSRLATVMEDFFRAGKAPWPIERNLLIAGLLEGFGHPSSRTGRVVPTPGLEIAYQP